MCRVSQLHICRPAGLPMWYLWVWSLQKTNEEEERLPGTTAWQPNRRMGWYRAATVGLHSNSLPPVLCFSSWHRKWTWPSQKSLILMCDL